MQEICFFYLIHMKRATVVEMSVSRQQFPNLWLVVLYCMAGDMTMRTVTVYQIVYLSSDNYYSDCRLEDLGLSLVSWVEILTSNLGGRQG